MENNTSKDEIVDVRSVVEAVSADETGVPLYQVESLCMRCGENVSTFHFPLLHLFCIPNPLLCSYQSILNRMMAAVASLFSINLPFIWFLLFLHCVFVICLVFNPSPLSVDSFCRLFPFYSVQWLALPVSCFH